MIYAFHCFVFKCSGLISDTVFSDKGIQLHGSLSQGKLFLTTATEVFGVMIRDEVTDSYALVLRSLQKGGQGLTVTWRVYT